MGRTASSGQAQCPLGDQVELIGMVRSYQGRKRIFVKVGDIHVLQTGQMIEPMLLIPFVENAVKHGVGLVEQPFVRVEVEVKGDRLLFKVMNKKGREDQVFKDVSSGIGLKNVKRRLELLYPKKHVLTVVEDDVNFSIDLKLTLK